MVCEPRLGFAVATGGGGMQHDVPDVRLHGSRKP